jgi:S1-C subfamily serine protease
MKPGVSGSMTCIFLLVFAKASCDAPAEERSANRATRTDTTVILHSRAPAADAFREAVRAALPGLVFVQVEGIPSGFRGWPGLQPGGNPFGDYGQQPVPVGSGSGFVLDSSGLVLTNNHVVREAAAVTVVLRDNRRVAANVVGRDPDSDIAVLRVQADGLVASTLGDSDSVQVGDWVLALGYPLGALA